MGTNRRSQLPTTVGPTSRPVVNTRRYGPSILVDAKGEKLLFDCGRAATVRLAEAGVGVKDIDKIFLTHLHSDHILSVPDILLVGWTQQRMTPLRVWGPEGTRDMMDNMLKTFAFDIHIRRDLHGVIFRLRLCSGDRYRTTRHSPRHS